MLTTVWEAALEQNKYVNSNDVNSHFYTVYAEASQTVVQFKGELTGLSCLNTAILGGRFNEHNYSVIVHVNSVNKLVQPGITGTTFAC